MLVAGVELLGEDDGKQIGELVGRILEDSDDDKRRRFLARLPRRYDWGELWRPGVSTAALPRRIRGHLEPSPVPDGPR